MLPADWARVEASRAFKLPEERDALIERYVGEVQSIQLATIFDYTEEMEADRVYLEAPYVDFDYRSEYSGLYARSYNPPPDKCERLLFFKGDTFLGFCVARPSIKPVGRSAITPPPSLSKFVSCLAPHVVHPYGQECKVKAWPFMSQDGIYGRCAHAAIWAIARYHHLLHNGPRCSISAVLAAAGNRAAPDRTAPSRGLYLPEVADAFAALGLPTLPCVPSQHLSGKSLEAIVCRYLNSGFPLALSTPRHLTVLIGYGYDENDEFFFIRSDDRVGAYQKLKPWDRKTDDNPDQWDMLLVPLPARIHVAGESAEIRARFIFEQQAGATAESAVLADELKENKLRLRTYAVEASKYKATLPDRGLGDEVCLHHQYTPSSGWIWVTEFQRRDVTGTERVIGEVAIDATSHPLEPAPVFANLPGRVVAWLPEVFDPRAKGVPVVDLYKSAVPLHKSP